MTPPALKDWTGRDLESEAAAAFARRHAHDLENADQEWGRRYFLNLLERSGGDRPLEETQLTLPFFTPEELAKMDLRTARAFHKAASGMPWKRVDRMAEFLRRTGSVAR